MRKGPGTRIAREYQHNQPPGTSLTPTDPPPHTRFSHPFKMKAIPTLAPDSFCHLTDRQPYQREQAELLRARARIAAGESVEVMEKEVVRRLAVSSSALLDVWWNIISVARIHRNSGGAPEVVEAVEEKCHTHEYKTTLLSSRRWISSYRLPTNIESGMAPTDEPVNSER
jgi:hypothetical protein